MDAESLARQAQLASYDCADLSTAQRNQILLAMAEIIDSNQDRVLAANRADVEIARQTGLGEALTDRLALSEKGIREITDSLRKVAQLNDPTDEVIEGYRLESGLKLVKKRVPLGVVCVIYESRPNVTVDIASLCLKSGNACILKGGKEAGGTNQVLFDLLQNAFRRFEVNHNIISFINSSERSVVEQLLKLDQYIDMVIPRGGIQLQRFCLEHSNIPVIIGGFGISHIFVDRSADLQRAAEVIINAKVQKPSACNALDTLLLHRDIAGPFLDIIKPRLAEYKVVMHADPESMQLLGDYELKSEMKESDPQTEWLSMQMTVAVTDSVQGAIAHMRRYGANHSDAIMTEDVSNARYFVRHAGSACVYVNASTRFSDGGQFGFGAEVAISTQKLHARGPVGLRDLTTCQYVLEGDYLPRS